MDGSGYFVYQDVILSRHADEYLALLTHGRFPAQALADTLPWALQCRGSTGHLHSPAV